MSIQQAYSLASRYVQGFPLRTLLESYKILPAINKEEAISALGVRHEVYCKEKKFEHINVAGIETDEFDHHSTQLLLSKGSDKIGCTRFIHNETDGEQHLLPIEIHGKDKLDSRVMDAMKATGLRYAEISRLAVHPDYRGQGSTLTGKGLFGASSALLTLICGIKAYADISDTRFMLAFVERGLLRRLERMNVPLLVIGEPIEHRGQRFPILIDRERIHLAPFMVTHFERIKNEMETHLAKAQTLRPTIDENKLDLVRMPANDFHPA